MTGSRSLPLDPDAGFKTLYLGSGEIRWDGAVHLDRNPDIHPDVVHDLDTYPWPFQDRRFHRIVCEHILEHLQEPDRALREIHRIAAPDGIVDVVTPHYSSPESWNDLTHRFHFGLAAFKPYCVGSYGTPRLFRPVYRRLRFGKGLPGWPGWLISRLSLDLYEKYFAFWFPARNMEIRLQVIKF